MTVSVPIISSFVNSAEEYINYYNKALELIRSVTEKAGFSKVNITLNPGDNTDKEMLYMRLTGSCIESGDEGQVSRGNRLGGVISSRRPFSIEGLSGKNPSYHAGKIYSVASWDIAHKIWEEQKVPCEVFIISQIDRPVDDPWVVVINSTDKIDKAKAEKIAKEILSDIPAVTKGLLDGRYPLT